MSRSTSPVTSASSPARMAVYVESDGAARAAIEAAARCGLKAKLAGRIESAPAREVVVPPLGVTLTSESFQLKR